MADETTTTTPTATNTVMIRIYANLIINGRRTIASLPDAYKAPVQSYIDSEKS